jgi:hypothetical protein
MKKAGNIKKHIIIFSIVCTMLLIQVSSCSYQNGVDAYLDKTADIIDRATAVAEKVSNLYTTHNQFTSTQVIQKCTNYEAEYDSLLKEFMSFTCPEECQQTRKYTIDTLTYSKQEINEYSAYFATKDASHIYRAEYYYNESIKSIGLVMGEFDRLSK